MNKFTYIIFTILIFILFKNSIIYGEEDSNPSNTYIVVINKLALEDIGQMKSLKRMVEEGSIGLMNPKGVTSYTNYEGFATLNATNKVLGGIESYYPIDILKKQNVLGQDINIYDSKNILSKIINTNMKNYYDPYFGIIGDILHKNNIKTAVFDYSDTADAFIGKANLVAMSSKGIIDYEYNYYNPYNTRDYKNNINHYYKQIFRNLELIKKSPSLIVIDTENLDNPLHTEQIILERIDNFLDILIEKTNKSKERIIIISPNIDDRFSKGLTPVIIWGKEVNKGLLYSNSTKTEGLITNLDIAPEIIKSFKIDIDEFKSKGLVNFDNETNLEYIIKLNNRINKTSKLRMAVFKSFTVIGSLLLLLYIIFIKFILKNLYIYNMFLWGIYFISVLTCILILAPMFNNNIYLVLILSIGLSILFIMFKIKIEFIYFMIFIVIIADILWGRNIISSSIFGYDPLIGARYYGIGNEIVGILIFTMSIITIILINKGFRRFILLLYSILFFIVISPKLGSNLGGGLAILCMLLYILYKGFQQRAHKCIIFKITTIVIIILFLFFIYIRIFASDTSHITLFINDITSDGLISVLNVIYRKVLVNIRLLGRSIWNKILFITIPVILIVVRNMIKDNIVDREYFIVFNSIIIGSLVGFIVNDSGLLLSAIVNLYLSIYLIYVTIDSGKYKGSE